MNIHVTIFKPSDQKVVKNFIISQWKEFGFSYQKEYDFDLDDPQKHYLQKD